MLSALPAAGRAAYRLFYDSDAKKLFDEATGPNELKTLERVYSAYFSTSIGDNAADRLGDLYFELGRFDRAADCWLDVLRERSDTDLSPALLSVKAAIALQAAHRQSELDQVRADLAQKYADDKVTLGGQTAVAPVLLDRLLKDQGPPTAGESQSSASSESGLALSETVEPVWQMRFGDTVEAGMTPPELTQWEQNTLSATVPAVSLSGPKLFANYLGYLFAIDLKSGKLLWARRRFTMSKFPRCRTRPSSPTRRDIRSLPPKNMSGACARFEGRQLPGAVYFCLPPGRERRGRLAIEGPLRLRRAGSEWSAHSGGGKNLHPGDRARKPSTGARRHAAACAGNPAARRQGDLEVRSRRVAAKQSRPVVGLEPAAGGPAAAGLPGRGDLRGNAPRRLRATRRRLRRARLGIWLPDRRRLKASSAFFFWNGYMQPADPTPRASEPVTSGEAFLIKGLQSTRLNAVDPNRMKVLWERPISKGSRLLAADEHAVYLGGAELSAIDLESRKLLWAARVPGGCSTAQVLVRKDAIWQSTPRGIVELDPRSGAVRRFFRGKDLGSVGGDLFLCDQFLLAVSNRTITAYPRKAGARAAAPRSASATTNKRVSNE